MQCPGPVVSNRSRGSPKVLWIFKPPARADAMCRSLWCHYVFARRIPSHGIADISCNGRQKADGNDAGTSGSQPLAVVAKPGEGVADPSELDPTSGLAIAMQQSPKRPVCGHLLVWSHHRR